MYDRMTTSLPESVSLLPYRPQSQCQDVIFHFDAALPHHVLAVLEQKSCISPHIFFRISFPYGDACCVVALHNYEHR
jgi:hypothetical protein